MDMPCRCTLVVLSLWLCTTAMAGRKTEDDASAALRHTRRDLCHAIVAEMHTEIHKHSLRKDGEDDIYETVPAICLAIVQNYSLSRTPAPARSWKLAKRATKLDDDEAPDPASFAHLMTLKKVCEMFTDEQQQELSELMYKETYAKDPTDIQASFCTGEVISPPPPPKRRGSKSASGGGGGGSSGSSGDSSESGSKKRKAKNSARVEDPPTPSMDELLKKYDTDGSISNLIEMERESPELMLEPAELSEVKTGAEELRCDVCRAATSVAHRRAKKRKARDEEQLSELAAELCVGTPEGSAEYPKYPGNPPLWGEMYTVAKKDGRWTMRKLKKGAKKEEQAGPDGSPVDYNRLVMKHAMISRACKQIVHEHPELDLAEFMFSHARATAAETAEGFCAEFCTNGGRKDEL